MRRWRRPQGVEGAAAGRGSPVSSEREIQHFERELQAPGLVESEVVERVGEAKQSEPREPPFVPGGVTLDLVQMRRTREAIIAAEIAAGRMADWPDSFRGFPFGVEGRDWSW